MANTKTNGNIFSEVVKNDPSLVAILRAGDLVEGTILEKNTKMILIDLGRYGTGVVYRGEFQNAREMVRNLKVDDPVHGKVIEIDNNDGLIELSLSEAGRQKAWNELQELQAKDEPIAVKITGSNKGGLTTELNTLLAFLPVSQLGNEHYPKVAPGDRTQLSQALEKLVGETINVKIIDLNPRTNKLIVSEKAAVELNAKELAKNYEVGQTIEGIVSGVADVGAFVRFTDNPAVEGLIHISELDHRVIENPKEVVKVDEAVKAKIIEIKDGRISLSLKSLQIDPWLHAQKIYKKGSIIKGKVYSFNQFGAIINLDGGLQGQVHVTAFGGLEEMKKALTAGNEYKFIVEEVKAEEKRITLELQK